MRFSTIEINEPFIITARLLPGIKVADAFISISAGPRDHEGRTVYTYHIDAPGVSYSASDLRSGCQGGTWQEGLGNLLAFLESATESTDDEPSGFPPAVVEWARANSDELACVRNDIENPDA